MAATSIPRLLMDHSTRLAQVRTALAQCTGSLRVVLRGKPVDLPACRVHHDLLIFRLANGRTLGEQRQMIAERNLPDTFFQDDVVPAAQLAQEEILGSMVDEMGLRQVLAKNGQTEPLLITADAVLVNGNRRLATMRLLARDGEPIAGWPFVEVAPLPAPPIVTEADVLALEAYLQIQPDTKADYEWYDEALLFDRLHNQGVTDADLAGQYERTVDKIQELRRMLALARNYLAAIGKPDAFTQLSKHKYAFDELQKVLAKETNAAKKALVEGFAFQHMQKAATHGRRYETIPAIHAHLDAIVDRVANEAKITSATPSPLNLALGIPPSASDRPYAAVLRLLTDKRMPAATIAGCIDEVISEEERRAEERTKATALDSSLILAHDAIDAASRHLVSPMTICGSRQLSAIDGLQVKLSSLRAIIADRVIAQ